MKKERAKLGVSLIVELFCCLLGSVAFCSALLPALGQDVSAMDCLLFAFVGIVLIFLLSRRWWITPVVVASLAVIGVAVIQYFQLWAPLKEYLQGFIAWVRDLYPYTQPYSENGSLFLVHLAASFPITLILYLYFRRFPYLPIWIVLGGGLLIWLYFADPEKMLSTTALLLIVLFALIARTNARSINRKLGLSEKIPSAAMQITALVLAPLVVLFAFVIGPKEDGEWQSKGLFNLVEDMGDVISFYGEGGSSGGSFNLSYSGLTPNGSDLGGDIEPDNRAIMRVKTSTPILLVGAVYDAYDGYGWYDVGGLGRFRFDSPIWRGRRREVYAVDKPGSGKVGTLFKAVSKTAVLEISMNVRFRSLFFNGKVENLAMIRGDDGTNIYFNTQGEVFTLDYPSSTATYELRTRVFDRSSENYDENMRLLVDAASSAVDTEYAELLGRSTAVPDTVEPFVYELVEEVTAGLENDYDKVLAIERWIGENCAYTRSPGDVPAGRDFVSWFLEDREGYCTYYASAMAVLARIAGFPARYATGYGLKQADRRPNTTAYVATNATAHAWAQVYFRGVGWVDFDPMQWNAFELAASDAPTPPEPEKEPEDITPIKPPELIDPESLLPELPPLEPQISEATAPRRKDNTGKILLILLGCAAAAFLIFLLVRFILLFFRVESFYYRLTHKYPDNAARADVCYKQLLTQLGFLGLKMEPADTILSFCERADAALADDPPHDSLSEVCRPVLLSRFAMQEPADEEVRRMCDFYMFLERLLRKKLGLRRYVLHRMILGR